MQKPAKIYTGPGRRKKLGDCLVEAGLINEAQLKEALAVQKKRKKKIGQVLIEIGAATDEEISRALSEQLEIPLINLHEEHISKEVIQLVPPELAENHLLMPIKMTGSHLLVAMTNPLDLLAIEDLRFATKMHIDIAVAPLKDILDSIETHYSSGRLEVKMHSSHREDDDLEIVHQSRADESDERDIADLKSLSELPPVVRLINSIFADAIKLKASDIHIEPQKGGVTIRFRIDGIMREILRTNRYVHSSLVSRIKVISNMDISIRRKPQDGRTQVRYQGSQYDFRVSAIPVTYGEKITIRVLDQENAGVGLEDLGMKNKHLEDFSRAIGKPQGILLVTGPTGSGKSSTLYACLNRLNRPTVNIITVEDPVEFDIDGINQVQINPVAGITFSAGLRSILRQDPDIVMVGEIRDSETASIAFQAGQTGHLVLSTLHTNDAPSAITRLLDLGVPSFLISASLIAVIGQRLVRKICPECKKPDPLTPQILKQLASYVADREQATFWKGTGCERCQYTGYSGRQGIFEILMLNSSLKRAIEPDVSAQLIQGIAEEDGYKPMSVDGIEKALLGLTTVEEVYRVAPIEDISSRMISPRESSAIPVIAPLQQADDLPKSGIAGPHFKKILIADDSPVTLRLLRNFLEAENYQVMTANNGVEAYKLAVREKPDLVITDYIMPEMDGLALTMKLKAQPMTRYIPIIILTVKDDEDSEVDALASGADDYIKKPFSAGTLLARVGKVLNRPVTGEGESWVGES